jgi:hypothetical protein
MVHAPRGETAAWKPGVLHPHLAWTHYRTLLRVDRSEARDFYEIEAIRHAWSAREALEIPVDSARPGDGGQAAGGFLVV